jgi:catechol 2,3-dioxygenase-like lactoylglutathione lyase family enzyme
MAIQHLSHIGLCVADLAESLRFYTQGLGFRERHRLEVAGEHAERLLEIPGLDLEAVYLERDGVCVELLHYRAPGHVDDNTHLSNAGLSNAGLSNTDRSNAPRPMNALGLTHLSLVTDDLDGDLDRLQAIGGRVLDRTRIDNPAYNSSVVFVLDPDGTRIELVERPGDPRRLPGT